MAELWMRMSRRHWIETDKNKQNYLTYLSFKWKWQSCCGICINIRAYVVKLEEKFSEKHTYTVTTNVYKVRLSTHTQNITYGRWHWKQNSLCNLVKRRKSAIIY